MSMVRDGKRAGKRPRGKLRCAECDSDCLYRNLGVLFYCCVGEVRLPGESDYRMTFQQFIDRVVKRIPRKVLRKERAVVWRQTEDDLSPVAIAEAGPKGIVVRKIAA